MISGVAEQRNQPHIETVFSCLTKALELLKEKPVLPSILSISSRTDAGVHALHNTAHIDIDFDYKSLSYKYPFNYHEDEKHCSQLISEINNILVNQNHLIRYSKGNFNSIIWILLTLYERILNIRKVKPNFSARHKARSRTYLYRLAVIDKKTDEVTKDNVLRKVEAHPFLTPFERDFCSIIK